MSSSCCIRLADTDDHMIEDRVTDWRSLDALRLIAARWADGGSDDEAEAGSNKWCSGVWWQGWSDVRGLIQQRLIRLSRDGEEEREKERCCQWCLEHLLCFLFFRQNNFFGLIIIYSGNASTIFYLLGDAECMYLLFIYYVNVVNICMLANKVSLNDWGKLTSIKIRE